MNYIYLKTTLILLAITGTLMAIGLRPVQHKPIGKINVDANSYVAQAEKPNSGT